MDVIKAGLDIVFLVIALFFFGITLFIFHKKKRIAKCLIVIGFSILCLLSFRPFSNFLLWGLESRYPPLMNLAPYTDVKYIIVLTSWDCDIPTIPYTSNLGYQSAFRTLEAHRIYKELSHAKIIISGSNDGGKLMQLLLRLLGVPAQNIDIDHADNTWASGENIKKLLGNQKVILVTSAIHLPRTVLSFTKAGVNFIPAPADYSYGYSLQYKFPWPRHFTYYLPNIDSLTRSNDALYEYLGIFWYTFKMKLSG